VKEPVLNFDEFAVLTFDCYGTLIDWEAGIWEALAPILANHNVALEREAALQRYAGLEAELEHGPYREYKQVLRGVLEGLGQQLGFTPAEVELAQFSQSVRDWPAFADSPAALQALQRKYQLAILSNIDDDLFAYSARRLQVTFDFIITAQQARSYKPSLNNFQLAFQRVGQPPSKILHVAQSLFHDHVPAKSLGLHTVWVNRRHDRPGFGATPPAAAIPDLEAPDLQTLARTIGLM
jgi:2-haloacid dehalogenase